ncbi:MAG TPA: hypothetical protein VGK94_13215 [Candidatus Polarisedimenticolia bacterium]
MTGFLLGGLRELLRDLHGALEALLQPGARLTRILPAVAGMAAGWILYVPIHELLHAAGCLATGGTVSEVRLAPIHGGAILGRLFGFVVPAEAGDYAGRVTGFDTRGSDLCYLATDAAPYLLTILIGVPLLRRLRRSPMPPVGAWLFGPAVILAAAPLISLTGDYFEMGTVLATLLPWWRGLAHLRSDDLFRLLGGLAGGEIEDGPSALLAIGVSILIALVLASWTYRLGIIVGTLALRPRRAS